MTRDDVKGVAIFAVLFLAIAALAAWASLSGWVDGGAPFPGADVIPDCLQGGE